MEEMLDDTLEMEDDEELEEEADEEVDKVLFDLTNGKLGQAGTVQTEVPVSVPLLAMLHRSSRLVCTGASGRGRDRTCARAISAATQWPPERIEALLVTPAPCIIFTYRTLSCFTCGQSWRCNIFCYLLKDTTDPCMNTVQA